MRHKETIELFNYWNEIRGNRVAPFRSEISPAALGNLLPSVMLLEEQDDGDVTFRLAGTRVCMLRCRELKGRPFSNIFQETDRPALMNVLHSVKAGDSLVVLDARADRGDGNSVPVEIALFPLADETPRILGVASVKKEPYWLGAEPAMLELRGIRHLDQSADLLFLNSRPSVPIGREKPAPAPSPREHFRLLNGTGPAKASRALRIFTVHDGGKK